ncbi:MAG: ImmA/IrrE family metallo-endopeptidase [Thalassolituus sp.]|uniref:ImmA/IrrE family metallo-endopeptidase n=1 Tax=Thalassolituus sp. TaxID=2030822 RepID=UPI0039820A34
MNWDDIEYHSSNKSDFDTQSPGDLFDLIRQDFTTLNRKTALSLGQLFVLVSGSDNSLFRKSSSLDLLQNVWLSKSKNKSMLDVIEKSIPSYNGNINSDFIREIAERSLISLNILEVSSILNDAGVSLVIEEYIPSSKVDGACYLLSNGTPCISISARYKRADSIWFTLLHELSHIALHYDILENPIIDDFDDIGNSKIERQANNLASNSIQPRDIARTSKSKQTGKESDLIEDSKLANVHPCLIAGHIRYSTQNYKIFSDIVNDKDLFLETIRGFHIEL